MVVVIDPNAARREWKVGRIKQTFPGPDGQVRVVDVRAKDKVLKLSISRISPLEIQNISSVHTAKRLFRFILQNSRLI